MNLDTLPDDPVVAVHPTHATVEATVRTLSKAHFDMARLSIIGKGYRNEEHALGFYAAGNQVHAWGAAGGFWGAIWALVPGPAVFVIPSVGLVAAAGPIGPALVEAFEKAVLVGGLSAVCGALASLGLPPAQAIRYEADIVADHYLVIVHGSHEDIALARHLLAAARAPEALPFHQAA
jgi:hypothetical protein